MYYMRFGVGLQMHHIDASLRTHTSPFVRWIKSYSSSTKLFVGGLSYDTNETVLKDAFEEYGDLIEAKVICDHTSSESKGYGFVRFTSETGASKALKGMHQLLDGRNILVEYAHNK